MTRRRKIFISALLSLLFLTVSWIATNSRVSLGGEKSKLQWFEILTNRGADEEHCDMTDSVVLIDVHYDKKLVLEKDDDGMPIGMVAATDKQKLKKLLEYLHQGDDYRYILLDVFLDKNISSPEDSSLYQLIASMPRIVIPYPEASVLADTCLNSKAGHAQYTTAIWENDFVKYPFLTDGKESVALKMYKDLTGRTITKHGFLYTDRWLVRKSAILTFELRENSDLSFRKHYLGWVVGDTLAGEVYESMIDEPGFATDKYVLIGDFKEDRHNTYAGEMSGPVINFNAYLTLLHGHHRFSLLMLVILWGVFFWLVWIVFSRSVLSQIFLWLGAPTILLVLCIITYLCFHEVYDILTATLLFYLLRTAVDIRRNKDKIIERYHKIKNYICVWKRKIKSWFCSLCCFL